MDLDKHRAVSYCGFKRCHDLVPELQKKSAYRKIFYPLWMGNWLTDVNQTSAFFSFLPDHDHAEDIDRNEDFPEPIRWRWLRRCSGRREMERARRAKEGQKNDYYQNRKNGVYVLPSFFRTRPAFRKRWEQLIAALWKEEWGSAEKAWEFSREMGELPESFPLDRPESVVLPGRAEEIGCYYPLDHFDVADQDVYFVQKEKWGTREELELDRYEERGFMTATAVEALDYAKRDWLKKAFNATQSTDRESTRKNRLADYQAVKLLGHGLHILQDFYAHSNYSDLLLICMAEEKLLSDYWNRRILYLAHETEVGTFNAFVLCKEQPTEQHGRGEKTPLVTGRFDPVDTVHTLLHLALANIHSQDSEAGQGGEAGEDRLYRILFGTFSDINIVRDIQNSVSLYRELSREINRMQNAVANFFVDYLVTPAVEEIFEEQEHIVDTYLLLKDVTLKNEETLQEYRKAGELLFHQRSIEKHLRRQISKAEQEGNMILPHHALLAKDHDKSNDAVKISYKLSCALAAEVSTEVLVKYFQGADFSELEPLLQRRYMHPKFHRENCAQTGSLNQVIHALNGKWFQYALQNPENGQSILGFDIAEMQVC